MHKSFSILSAVVFFTALFPASVIAAEAPYCEVVRVAGSVQLNRRGQAPADIQQGMMILKGDKLVVSKASSADLAFDPQWQNVAHLNENTRVVVRYLNPTRLEMVSGDIYSKLDSLPKGSSFEVVTPTAIASVRGTKFRTTHEKGTTTVYNDSETSLVYVYRLDENGNRSGRAVVLKPGESTTLIGEVEVYDSMIEDLQDSRDREDQDQLNDDLKNRVKNEASSGDGEQFGDGEGDTQR